VEHEMNVNLSCYTDMCTALLSAQPLSQIFSIMYFIGLCRSTCRAVFSFSSTPFYGCCHH